MEKSIPFEVNCYDVVKTHHVVVKNMITGEEFKAPALKWEWKNEFDAHVTFIFGGREFTVLAEVHPEFDY